MVVSLPLSFWLSFSLFLFFSFSLFLFLFSYSGITYKWDSIAPDFEKKHSNKHDTFTCIRHIVH
jgi:hypothetical protein